MGTKRGKKTVKKKGKTEKKKKKPYKYASNYKVEGGKLAVKNKKCPKCGDSFLAGHKNRLTCGKCKYTEMH